MRCFILLVLFISLVNGSAKNYLILTSPKWVSELDEFIEFRQKTYSVTVVTTDESGTTSDSVLAWLKSLSTIPDYLLLVGNVDEIGNSGPVETIFTDFYYSLPDTVVPQIYVGRFPVHTKEQLKNIIRKTMYMENNYATLKKHVEMAADHNLYGIDYYSQSTNSSLSGLPSPYTSRFIIYRTGDPRTKSEFIQETFYDAQPNIYIYTGHGLEHAQEIGSRNPWKFEYSDADTMTNTVYPVSFGLACHSGDLTAENCFGESFVNSAGGAALYVGAGTTVYARDICIIGYTILGNLFGSSNEDKTVGEGWRDAIIKLGYYKTRTNVRVYSILGDPALRVAASDSATQISDKKLINSNDFKQFAVQNSNILELNLSFTQDVTVELFTLRGQEISKMCITVPAGKSSVELSDVSFIFASNMYLCRVRGKNIAVTVPIIVK